MKIKDIITEENKDWKKSSDFIKDIGSAIKAGASGATSAISGTTTVAPAARMGTTVDTTNGTWQKTRKGWVDNKTKRIATDPEEKALNKRAELEADEEEERNSTSSAGGNRVEPGITTDPVSTNPAKPGNTAKPAATSKEGIVGRIPVPAGHVLKMVMPSPRGPIDYFKYPNGKWFVQWTTGSSLQLETDPEKIENLNYLLPSQATSIKVTALGVPNQAKGKRK